MCQLDIINQTEKTLAVEAIGEIGEITTIDNFAAYGFIKYDINSTDFAKFDFFGNNGHEPSGDHQKLIRERTTRPGLLYFNTIDFFGDLSQMKKGDIVQFDVKENSKSGKFVARSVKVVAQKKALSNKAEMVQLNQMFGSKNMGFGDGQGLDLMDLSTSASAGKAGGKLFAATRCRNF